MKLGRRQVALALGAPVLSVALLGGVAAAAFQPVDGQATAHPERTEQAKPPVPSLEEILDQLVQAGKITATQREAILAAVKQFSDKAEQRPAKPTPKVAPKERAPKVEGEAGKKKEEAKKERESKDARKAEQKVRIDVHRLLGDSLRSAVAYLALDARAVQEQLRAGKSLAEIATANGKTREGLIGAISAPAGVRIDELKAAGKLTDEQAVKTRAQVEQAAAKIADTRSNVRKVTPPGQTKKRS